MVKYITIPAILLFVGGMFSILGAFWVGINNEKQSEEIKKLTQENKELASKMINFITGGDSYAYFEIGVRHVKGIYKNIGLKLNLVGNFPLSDVTIKLMRIIDSKSVNGANKAHGIEQIANYHYPLITHDLLFQSTSMPLIDLSDDRNRYIQISISSRNGEISQQMQFSKKENGYYSMATKVVRHTYKGNGSFDVKTLLERKDDDFNGPINWIF